jgi:hypothetical protein
MRLRAVLASLTLAALGAVALTGLAPWFNPCIGAPRFVDCIDSNEVREIEMQAGGTLTCRLGICDYFPSMWERLVQALTFLLLVGGVGALAALCVRERRWLAGLGTGGAAIALFVLFAWFMYPHTAV